MVVPAPGVGERVVRVHPLPTMVVREDLALQTYLTAMKAAITSLSISTSEHCISAGDLPQRYREGGTQAERAG